MIIRSLLQEMGFVQENIVGEQWCFSTKKSGLIFVVHYFDEDDEFYSNYGFYLDGNKSSNKELFENFFREFETTVIDEYRSQWYD